MQITNVPLTPKYKALHYLVYLFTVVYIYHLNSMSISAIVTAPPLWYYMALSATEESVITLSNNSCLEPLL